jgi:hypothetical protein
MSQHVSPSALAIRLPARESEHSALAAFVGPVAWETAAKFLPKDDDELNAKLSAGAYTRVIFENLDSLYEMIWKEQADLDRWRSVGVEIDLASPPEGGTQWRPLVSDLSHCYLNWRSAQRKRQIVAAIILSATALLAMAVLFFMIPSVR